MPSDQIYMSPPNIGSNEIARVVSALESGWVAPVGPDLKEFEAAICAFTGVEAAVALSSGTAALQLGLQALGVQPGDEVICPTFTFAATAFAAIHAGATPVFVDCETTSWNLDPQLFDDALRARAARNQLPAAVIGVDLFGNTCDYESLIAIARRFEVPFLADAAEALGAEYNRRGAGSLGDAAALSFNGNKIITTSGGGMFMSNNTELADRVRHWSTQSREDFPWYEHNEVGFNYRMSNILAALGIAQLERLPSMIEKRRQIRDWYTSLLAPADVAVSQDPPWGRGNAWLTTVRFPHAIYPDAATTVRVALEAQQIESRPVWKPMHQQPIFTEHEAVLNGNSDRIFAEGLCLPSGVALDRKDVERISKVILDTLAQ